MANKAPSKTAFVAVALMRGESRKLAPAVTRCGALRHLEQKQLTQCVDRCILSSRKGE